MTVPGVTDGHRQTVTEAEISQREADDPVDCPSVDSPVEQRVEHGLLCLHDRRGHAVKWRRQMRDRLCHAEIHQADAHASRKKHAEPGEE